jgi:hypothetical protein
MGANVRGETGILRLETKHLFWYNPTASPIGRETKEKSMFLGWYDPDKKKPARDKVEAAVERYVEKFGGDVTFIPRFTFYVGVEDKPVEVELAAA